MAIENRIRQDGFTLIETMIAMVVFTIGILGLFGMQTTAIKENLTANSITSGSAWAMDQVEQLLNQDYENLLDTDSDGNNCGGLDDWGDNADGSKVSGDVEPIYKIYWNIARGCSLTNVTFTPTTPENEIYSPKHLRIIVTRENGGGVEREFAVFNYIKQNVL
ncbi:prepilin-type N-terminal cleavage/methylation domain-containing protein [Desulfobulbus sp. US1]|uniref:Prepilin-type N-terminal cleavage/methylation domain-containing protein n=1 Tax=Candidatus Electrothrix communis TaxID=1859133 RepID=A0A3S3UE84_9BACT|nr:prepilin-type N-terminal cleavage/methylation domain-containing protein [Desulfobulbus sp. US4]MCW5204454.1 prepilin-type N-terminal cleavage/methylation domain-containing protein [Desulfobulbus sp. N2]MCW5208711.1 prepilin-type N-terminal cleavage/methylation domain-containing protein [Desulfobulbus sp. US1]RWX49754.1 prepilin-type N-terminal cleavage/methylation domain-containing protein [Candidatus Electrothrix communis]WLE97786.1 MAG: prepilin-type N-terminal cleavage/methylation domain-